MRAGTLHQGISQLTGLRELVVRCDAGPTGEFTVPDDLASLALTRLDLVW